MEITKASGYPWLNDEKFLYYVKISLAVAILRHKPQDLSAKGYAERLARRLAGTAKTRSEQVKDLSDALLQAKQELLRTKLPPIAPPSGSECGSVHDGEHPQEASAGVAIPQELCVHPTPPLSSKHTDPPHPWKVLAGHVQFLHSVSLLCRSQENSYSSVLCDRGETVVATLQRINQWLAQEPTRHQWISVVPHSVQKSCLRGLKKLMDIQALRDHHVNIRKAVCSFVQSLVQLILQDESSSFTQLQHIARQIVYLGAVPTLKDELLSKLATSTRDFSNKLKEISRGRALLSDHATQYNNLYHILWAQEHLLIRAAPASPCLGEVTLPVMSLLADSLLHISGAFPVFALYIWRLQGLIARFEDERSRSTTDRKFQQ